MGEVFIKVNGRMRHPWRAVDQDGNVLEVLVTNKRDAAASRSSDPKARGDLSELEVLRQDMSATTARPDGRCLHRRSPSRRSAS